VKAPYSIEAEQLSAKWCPSPARSSPPGQHGPDRAARPMTSMKIHGSPTQWVDEHVLEQKNIYVACMEDEDLNYLEGCVGSRNIVFGTDFGHTDIGSEIDGHRMLVERADLAGTLNKLITDDNARATVRPGARYTALSSG
jgi:hypothetical protein